MIVSTGGNVMPGRMYCISNVCNNCLKFFRRQMLVAFLGVFVFTVLMHVFCYHHETVPWVQNWIRAKGYGELFNPRVNQFGTQIVSGDAVSSFRVEDLTSDLTSLTYLKPTAKREILVSKSTVFVYNNTLRTRKSWDGQRYIVYVCTGVMKCAGWGDRQRGIFSTYLLSLVTNRTFKVQMQIPCPLSRLFHSGPVKWDIEPSELEGLSSIYMSRLSDYDFIRKMESINFNEEYPQDVVYWTTNFDAFYALRSNPNYKDVFLQKVQGRRHRIVFADVFLHIFRLNKIIYEKVGLTMREAYPTKNHKLVCAHVRFGTNPTIKDDSQIRNNLTTIEPIWNFLDQYSDPSRYRMFVATDWEEFRSMILSKYREVIIDVQGNIIHIDRAMGGSAHSFDFCEGLEKVILDQYVLGKCDVLLLTKSGFGKAAALLRRSNDELFYMDNGRIKSLSYD